MKPQPYHQLIKIKRCMWAMIIGLFLSGITAFPIETELHWLSGHASVFPVALQGWLHQVYAAVSGTNARYPYLGYGTDWLAFAHVMLALLFIGPLKDSVKNLWVIQFGMLACVCIFPLAFIAGGIRGIPVFWRLIDCSFGVVGILPLYLAYRYTRQLMQLTVQPQPVDYAI